MLTTNSESGVNILTLKNSPHEMLTVTSMKSPQITERRIHINRDMTLEQNYEEVIQKYEHDDRRKIGAALKQNLYVDYLE